MSYFEITPLAVFTPFEETPQIRRDKMGVLLYLDEVIKELEVIIKSRRVGKVLASNGCLSLAVTKSKLRDYTVEAWVIAKRSSQRRKLEAKRSLREAKAALRVAKALLNDNLTLVDLYALNVIDLRIVRYDLPHLVTFCGIDLNVPYPF